MFNWKLFVIAQDDEWIETNTYSLVYITSVCLKTKITNIEHVVRQTLQVIVRIIIYSHIKMADVQLMVCPFQW